MRGNRHESREDEYGSRKEAEDDVLWLRKELNLNQCLSLGEMDSSQFVITQR